MPIRVTGATPTGATARARRSRDGGRWKQRWGFVAGGETPVPPAEVVRPLADLEHAVRSTAIARAVETAVEPDRAMLAYAVHDGLTQVVTASVLELESLARRVDVAPSEAARALREAVDELRRALDEIREMLTTLTPSEPVTAESLEQTLGRALERWQPRNLVRRGRPHVGPRDGARRRVVRDRRGGGQRRQARPDGPRERPGPGDRRPVEVSVEDHGTGSTVGSAAAGHLGLQMMRRRVAEADGTGHRSRPRRRDAGRRPSPHQRSRRYFVKVLIVDDHALVRRGLGHVVRDCFQAEVVEARTRPRRSS